MLKLKVGVRFRLKEKVLQPEMNVVMQIVEGVFNKYGIPECTVTSGMDSNHGEKSLHYEGRALDFRTKNVSRVVLPKVINDIRLALTSDYDVVMEALNDVNEHLHIELDNRGLL